MSKFKKVSLYSRLRPEYITSLDKDRESYPLLVKYVEVCLKDAVTWDNLTIAQVSSISILSPSIELLSSVLYYRTGTGVLRDEEFTA